MCGRRASMDKHVARRATLRKDTCHVPHAMRVSSVLSLACVSCRLYNRRLHVHDQVCGKTPVPPLPPLPLPACLGPGRCPPATSSDLGRAGPKSRESSLRTFFGGLKGVVGPSVPQLVLRMGPSLGFRGGREGGQAAGLPQTGRPGRGRGRRGRLGVTSP